MTQQLHQAMRLEKSSGFILHFEDNEVGSFTHSRWQWDAVNHQPTAQTHVLKCFSLEADNRKLYIL